MRTMYVLFVLLPLAMSVGCVGCDVPDSQETGRIDHDTVETGDTDVVPGYSATFDFAPIAGTPTIAVSKGEDKFSCLAPCQITVEKIGTWSITATDDVFWMIGWTHVLTDSDADVTFTYDWSEDYAYGVEISDPTRYVSPSGDDFFVYTEIRSPDGELANLGHDYVALQGVLDGALPLTGYTYDIESGGYQWTGYLQEDLEILHFEKREVGGDLIVSEDWRRTAAH